MSLNWSVENVKYFKDHPDELWVKYGSSTEDEYEDVNAETKSLLFGMMIIGIGDISYSTAPEFYARWKVLEKYDDLYVYSKLDENKNIVKQYITPKMIMKHINMFANVSYESPNNWIKRMQKNYDCDKYRDDSMKPSINDIKNILKKEKEIFENSF